MNQSSVAVDWAGWLERWEAQQDYVIPFRGERFDAMLDVVDVIFADKPFAFIDVACGPGSLLRRVLDRFPAASAVAVDLDPLLIAMGRGALGDRADRLRFEEVDLRDESWSRSLGRSTFDAAFSSTALHWLRVGDLVDLYRQLGELIRPGGVFINCDNMAFSPQLPTFRQIDETLRSRYRDAQSGGETFTEWWDSAGEDPGMKELFEERQRRFTWREPEKSRAGFDIQKVALEMAGFREVSTMYQRGQNRVLVAIR